MENMINSGFVGFDDRNRFLLQLGGDRAAHRLQRLRDTILENPSVTFSNNAREANLFISNNPAKEHENAQVQALIAASAEEFDDMKRETKRRSKYWKDKPADSGLAVFLRTLTSEKDEPIQPVENSYNLSGFDACNAFLLEPVFGLNRHFNLLSSLRLPDPDIEFTKRVSRAMEWKSAHSDNEPHSDPQVQRLIEMNDEEFEEAVRENARRSYFWHGADRESFLTLFVRTLDEKEHQSAEQAACDDDRFRDFGHVSATEYRREHKLPQLSDSVQTLRTSLLEEVVGQEQAVHAFCEGIFNSEVLLESDKDRVRPRAVFTFAGAPGVGKTYLAQQAAKQLGIPFKRFDMTEYSSRESHLGLIGFECTWKNSTAGLLTTFVHENPHCVLLFDEVEKAHRDTLQIFYQMLDAGVVTDKFYSTKTDRTDDEVKRAEVSFKDAIIIFTTNAGRELYENENCKSSAEFSEKTLLNALKTEKDSLTGNKMLPEALVSRIATGYPLLFNKLRPHHLFTIAEKEITRVQQLFLNEYGIHMKTDRRTVMSLLYAEGANADARTLRARVELFLKNEFYKLVVPDSKELSEVTQCSLTVQRSGVPEKIARLFERNGEPEILLYSNGELLKKHRTQFNGNKVHFAHDVNEAMELAGEHDIDFALIDAAKRDKNGENGTMLFNRLRSRLPQLPIYVLEGARPLDDELVTALVRAGARGKVVVPREKTLGELEKQLRKISDEAHLAATADELAAQRKVLRFKTSSTVRNGCLNIKLHDFGLKFAPDAEDVDDLLGDAERPTVRFNDVIGAQGAKRELKFFVEFLKHPKKYAAQVHRLPKGVLLHGRPGTGKTLLAKAVAGETELTFIHAAASSFVNKYIGSGPAAVRALFRKARRYAPSIIFIDEVDAIAKQRTGSECFHAQEDTLNALLAEMDGFATDPKRPVFVLAATNYAVEAGKASIGVLDEAFLRRFDRSIKVELPNQAERTQLLQVMLSKCNEHNVSTEMVDNVAVRSVGTSPAVLANIIETAKRIAFEAQKPLDDDSLEEAFEITKRGDKKDSCAEVIHQIACHECGHALVSHLGGSTPMYLTIEARGDSGGYMESHERTVLNSREELLRSIRTFLGGRAAEMVCYGSERGVTTGAEQDIREAVRLATEMITVYGMDEKLGFAYVGERQTERSPEVRARVNEILSEQLSDAIRLIEENKARFDSLCEALLQKNRLTSVEIERLLCKGGDQAAT